MSICRWDQRIFCDRSRCGYTMIAQGASLVVRSGRLQSCLLYEGSSYGRDQEFSRARLGLAQIGSRPWGFFLLKIDLTYVKGCFKGRDMFETKGDFTAVEGLFVPIQGLFVLFLHVKLGANTLDCG